jgi:hypothetical protein
MKITSSLQEVSGGVNRKFVDVAVVGVVSES